MALPLALKLGARVKSAFSGIDFTSHPSWRCGLQSVGDVISATIETRSAQISDSVSKNNVLFVALKREHDRRASLTQDERDAEDRAQARVRLRDKLFHSRAIKSNYLRWEYA